MPPCWRLARAATKRFAIDTDRVFLSGHSLGGDAAWDIALAHPDLWAGLVAIVPTADRYVTHYWPNARRLPIYVVGGELDRAGSSTTPPTSTATSPRASTPPTSSIGAGATSTSPTTSSGSSTGWAASGGRFFPRSSRRCRCGPGTGSSGGSRLEGPPPRTIVLPEAWPPPVGYAAAHDRSQEGRDQHARRSGAGPNGRRVWLSPELIDFGQPLTVTIDGKRIHKGPIASDARGAARRPPAARRPAAPVLGRHRHRRPSLAAASRRSRPLAAQLGRRRAGHLGLGLAGAGQGHARQPPAVGIRLKGGAHRAEVLPHELELRQRAAVDLLLPNACRASRRRGCR